MNKKRKIDCAENRLPLESSLNWLVLYFFPNRNRRNHSFLPLNSLWKRKINDTYPAAFSVLRSYVGTYNFEVKIGRLYKVTSLHLFVLAFVCTVSDARTKLSVTLRVETFRLCMHTDWIRNKKWLFEREMLVFLLFPYRNAECCVVNKVLMCCRTVCVSVQYVYRYENWNCNGK